MPQLSSTQTRILTAIGLLCLFFAACFCGDIGIFIFLSIAVLLAQWEFCSLFIPCDKWQIKVVALAITIAFLLTIRIIPEFSIQQGIFTSILCFALLFLAMLSRKDSDECLRSLLFASLSFIYIPVLISPILFLTPIQQLFILSIPVASDTCAYFIGIRFGKHKIWPQVSPKKSVEGCFAGLLAAIVVSLIFGLGFNAVGTNSLLSLIVVGIFVGIASQLGDFFESALKRRVDIKDSSCLLPGHGGVLDRIDSLLFAIPAYAICSAFF